MSDAMPDLAADTGSKDEGKTREQLVSELRGLRQRFAGLEASAAESQRAVEALHQDDTLFRCLVDTIAAGVFIYQGSRVRYANPDAVKLTGYTQEELVTGSFWDSIHPDFRELLRARWRASERGEQAPWRYELKIVTKRGRERWVDFTGGPIEFEGAPAALGIACDITGRKHVEELLRRHGRCVRALRGIDQAILAVDSPAKIAQAALGHLRRLVGCRRASVVEFGSEAGDARVLAGDVEGTTKLEAGSRVWIEPSLVEELQRGGMQVVEDILTLPELSVTRQILRAEGMRSWISVPLIASGETIGSLNLGSAIPRAFGPEHVDITREVAASLSIAIQNARLVEAETRRSAELARSNALVTALSQVAVRLGATLDSGQVMETLGTELERLGIKCFIGLLGLDDQSLTVHYVSLKPERRAQAEMLTMLGEDKRHLSRERFPHHDALVERQRAVFLPDALSGLVALLSDLSEEHVGRLAELVEIGTDTRAICLPLTIGGEAVGILAMWGQDLQESDLPAGSLFASQVASALENARLLDTITRHQSDLQRVSGRIIAAQEAERKRISRELHDEMGQALTAISINLAAIQRGLSSDAAGAIKETLMETRSLADQTLERVRQLSLDLRPAMLDDLGLVPTLRWYLNGWSQRMNIKAALEAINLEERLLPELETVLYRVMQEALTNVARHAEASRVIVRLERKKSTVVAFIEDDGNGFDVEEVTGPQARRVGVGLLGIRERMARLGGSLSIRSQPGEGTRVSIEVPLALRWLGKHPDTYETALGATRRARERTSGKGTAHG